MQDNQFASTSRVRKGIPTTYVEVGCGVLVIVLVLLIASPAHAKPLTAAASIVVDDNGHVTRVAGPVVNLCDYARDMSVSLDHGKLTLKGGGLCKPGEAPTMKLNVKTCSVNDSSVFGPMSLNCG